MTDAFKLGFMYAAGALTAGVFFLILYGLYDWATEWLVYLVDAIRLRLHREKGGTA
jgi:hypothetical protein